MLDPEKLQGEILAKLSEVIDPETGTDIIHMRLIDEIQVDESGSVYCRFKPSSPLCPIALPLAMNILNAINSVEGVKSQKLEVVDFIQAEELNKLISQLAAELEYVKGRS